ncbi:TIGR00266 family protein [Lactobacillus acidophilus]|uniref:TIGR00266 family protein n=1 Tax=Lactobacillus acidophilus TaxID=1579 RepID=UPI0021A80E5A|nr:TIGR00266 family protein [Lactobacillus acidophilus]MCT3602375.1 TIGR00266 family protein [Lactobacillus acidophilus]MCT3622913.1 TIGR00266 family protein [Lactobacillus acidophilus]
MSDNRMNYSIDKQMQFPLVDIELEPGEKVFIQRGSMVYHSTSIKLNTKVNGTGSGIGKLIRAVGRSITSGESFWITEVQASRTTGKLAVAPALPGEVLPLKLGKEQYRINDGKFLAMDGSASYSMKKQSVGRAIFSGTGGFFVMTTSGEGTVLCNAYGSIKKITLNNDEITIDNNHVVAWSTGLDYDIHFDNGFIQSIGTGEGIVNTFKGSGEVYIQSLNLETFAGILDELIPGNEK